MSSMKKYTLKKGAHYSTPSELRFHFGIKDGAMTYKFRFMFTDECIYPVVSGDDLDINKMAGFSLGLHHHNSVRFGWLPSVKEPGKIDLFRYYYNQGKRIPDYTPIATIGTGEWFDGELAVTRILDKALFEVRKDGTTITSSSVPYKVPRFTWGYYLKPFFGGDNACPKDMSIYLDWWDGYYTPGSIKPASEY